MKLLKRFKLGKGIIDITKLFKRVVINRQLSCSRRLDRGNRRCLWRLSNSFGFAFVRETLGILIVFREFNACLTGQVFHHIDKVTIVDVHQKTNGITIGLATKAVVILLITIDVKRRRFFLMKRTAARIGASCFFQFHALTNQVDNISSIENLIYRMLRNGHSRYRDWCNKKKIQSEIWINPMLCKRTLFICIWFDQPDQAQYPI